MLQVRLYRTEIFCVLKACCYALKDRVNMDMKYRHTLYMSVLHSDILRHTLYMSVLHDMDVNNQKKDT
jgi:hypothetical protein